MDAMNNSVQRNNEVVGQKANASVAKSVLGRFLPGPVREFFNVGQYAGNNMIPVIGREDEILNLLHAA